MTRKQCKHPGYTLIELVIVVGINVILAGLVLPAIQRVREAANVTKCQNNLKQLGEACHLAQAEHGRLPPGIGYYPNRYAGAYGTGMFHLLPYLEQYNLYRKANGPYLFGAWNNNVYAEKVPIFLCPSDPSANGGVVNDENDTPWGGNGYSGNVQVFARTKRNGQIITTQGDTSLISIRDGQTQTILFAEHYAHCTNQEWQHGGNLWAYWKTNLTFPWHPGFTIGYSGQSVGFASKFQLQPPMGDCDPVRASTGHTNGMQICMCDGSVRTLSPWVSGEVWWALCTPRNGDFVPANY